MRRKGNGHDFSDALFGAIVLQYKYTPETNAMAQHYTTPGIKIETFIAIHTTMSIHGMGISKNGSSIFFHFDFFYFLCLVFTVHSILFFGLVTAILLFVSQELKIYKSITWIHIFPIFFGTVIHLLLNLLDFEFVILMFSW